MADGSFSNAHPDTGRTQVTFLILRYLSQSLAAPALTVILLFVDKFSTKIH